MTLQEKIKATNAMADAIMRGDKFYELCVNSKNDEWRIVSLPAPQRAGTGVQQRTYAVDKAMDIIVKRTG